MDEQKGKPSDDTQKPNQSDVKKPQQIGSGRGSHYDRKSLE